MEEIIIIGAGGHAKVLIDCLEEEGKYKITEVVDDNPALHEILGYKIHRRSQFTWESKVSMIIAIGNAAIRKQIAGEYDVQFATTIHPTAIFSKYAKVGAGSQVFAGAIVNPGATIGQHCIINTGAVVEHDCVIHDFVHLSPHTSLAGGVTVGSSTHIGIGATVIENVTIGSNVIIGAGAVVVSDIPNDCTAVGIPAKPIKFHEPGL